MVLTRSNATMIEECLVVDIRVEGDACPLADATDATGAIVEASPPVLRRDGNALLRFSVDLDEEGALAAVLEDDDRIRYLHRASGADVATYRCLSREPCVLHDLADEGLLLESVRYHNGIEHLTGSVVGTEVLQGVMAAAGDAIGVTIERVNPLGAEVAGSPERQWNLTPSQEEALIAALNAGYFEVPKEATASDVARELSISKSAFLERLRRGQSGLLRQALQGSSN